MHDRMFFLRLLQVLVHMQLCLLRIVIHSDSGRSTKARGHIPLELPRGRCAVIFAVVMEILGVDVTATIA